LGSGIRGFFRELFAKDPWTDPNVKQQARLKLRTPTGEGNYEIAAPVKLTQLLVETRLAQGYKQAREMIEAGAVRLDGGTVRDLEAVVPVPATANRLYLEIDWRFGKWSHSQIRLVAPGYSYQPPRRY